MRTFLCMLGSAVPCLAAHPDAGLIPSGDGRRLQICGAREG